MADACGGGMAVGQGNAYNMMYGRDEMLLGALAIGADGGVGSTYNLPFMAPIYAKLQSAFAAGDLDTARAMQLKSRQLVQLMKAYGYADGGLRSAARTRARAGRADRSCVRVSGWGGGCCLAVGR